MKQEEISLLFQRRKASRNQVRMEETKETETEIYRGRERERETKRRRRRSYHVERR